MELSRQITRIRTVLLLLAVGVAVMGCASGADQTTPSPAPTDTPVGPSATASEPPTHPLREAAVAVSPPSGPPGTEVQLTAAGFPPETEIELAVGPVDAPDNALASVRTNADGFLATALAIPGSARAGVDWVVVAATADGDASAVSNVFQVTEPQYEPTVSIAPTSGPPETEIQVVAEGLPSSTSVEVGLGREDSEHDVVGTFQTGSDGSLTAQVMVPGYAEPDERWVAVVTTEDQAVKAISSIFQVTQVQYQGTVAISPTSGPPGTRVEIVARGLPPNAMVNVGVGRVDSEYDVVATAQTDANGRVDTQITMPAFVEPQDRWVIVVAAQQQPVQVISDTFDVTRGPTSTPSGNLFTRTNIYLIAIGDDGQSGKAIGCDDSVVPVEVAIEPTIAPLTAALHKLLAIESSTYGRSRLYNALYQSDLALKSVSIQSREAIIRLSGTLTLGGVCDEPRVRAQLQETALEYATVDQVSIFVNGAPLEQLLGQGPG